MQYPVKIVPDGDQYLATFRDIPEAITCGATKAEALDMARDALITAMDFYFEDERAVTAASVAQKDEVMVELPASLAVKILLLNEMVAQKVHKARLANMLKITRHEAGRLVDLHHTTKIDALADAFRVLGKQLKVSVQ